MILYFEMISVYSVIAIAVERYSTIIGLRNKVFCVSHILHVFAFVFVLVFVFIFVFVFVCDNHLMMFLYVIIYFSADKHAQRLATHRHHLHILCFVQLCQILRTCG